MHALNAIANGEGPRTFGDLATQEFQWSKSVMIIMLRYTRRYFMGLPLKLKAQFLFCQLWYPLCALAMAGGVVIPVVALLTGRVWAHVDYLTYLTYALPLAVLLLCVVTWATHSTQSCRPLNTKLLSWEGLSFVFARWPWVVLGCVSAVFDCVRGKEFPFKVTPKGGAIEQDAPLRVVAPYLLISLFCSLPVVTVEDPRNAAGFYLFSTLTSILYLVIAAVVTVNHGREQGRVVGVQADVLQPPAGAQRAVRVRARDTAVRHRAARAERLAGDDVALGIAGRGRARAGRTGEAARTRRLRSRQHARGRPESRVRPCVRVVERARHPRGNRRCVPKRAGAQPLVDADRRLGGRRHAARCSTISRTGATTRGSRPPARRSPR